MISAIEIYNEIERLNKSDGISGNFNFEEFNDMTTTVENTLMNFYCDIFETSNEIMESLQPFVLNVPIVLNNGFADFPANYRRKNDIRYRFYADNEGQELIDKLVSCDYCHANEWGDMHDSAIRRPVLTAKKQLVRYRFINGKIEFTAKIGTIELSYIANPIHANIAFTTNTATDEQIIDVPNTVNFQWKEKDRQNLIDLYCMRLGMQLRDTALIQWANSPKKITT